MLRNNEGGNEAVTWSANAGKKMVVRPFVESQAKFSVNMQVSLQGFDDLQPVQSRELGVALDNHNLKYQGKDENGDPIADVQGHVGQELYTINKHMNDIRSQNVQLTTDHDEKVEAEKYRHKYERTYKYEQIAEDYTTQKDWNEEFDTNTGAITSARVFAVEAWKSASDLKLSAHKLSTELDRSQLDANTDAQTTDAEADETLLNLQLGGEASQRQANYGTGGGSIGEKKTNLESQFNTANSLLKNTISDLESQELAKTIILNALVTTNKSLLNTDTSNIATDLQSNITDAKNTESDTFEDNLDYHISQASADHESKDANVGQQIAATITASDASINSTEAMINAIRQADPDDPVGTIDKLVEITNSMSFNEQRILDQLELANKEINKAAKALSDKFSNVFVDERKVDLRSNGSDGIVPATTLQFDRITNKLTLSGCTYATLEAAKEEFPAHCVIHLGEIGQAEAEIGKAVVTSVGGTGEELVLDVVPFYEVSSMFVERSDLDNPLPVSFSVSHTLIRYDSTDDRKADNHDIVGTMDEKRSGDAWLDSTTGLPISGIVPARYEVNDANGIYQPVFKIFGISEVLAVSAA